MIVLILKLILKIILIILAIIFILSLFSITYEIDANKNIKELKSNINIQYLFGLVKFRGVFNSLKKDNKKFIYNLNVLFFNIKNSSKKEKAVKYKEEYVSDAEKENLDYIFDDKDDFFDADTKNKLVVASTLNKKRKSVNTLTRVDDATKAKTNKKSMFAKIIGLLREKKHKTLKELFAIIKEIINLLKPEKTKVKFTFTTFKIDIRGKIRIINLIFIAIKVLLKKEIRELIF